MVRVRRLAKRIVALSLANNVRFLWVSELTIIM